MDTSPAAKAFDLYRHPVWRMVGLYKAGSEDYKTPTCDNYWLFTAVADRITDSQLTSTGTLAAYYSGCQLSIGLYERFPASTDTLSQDEVYGQCYLDASKAYQVNAYAWYNWWSYNITHVGKWTLDSFLGRFPCFAAYVAASAGISPGFSQIPWCLGFVASALTSRTETSGKMLAYLQIPTMSKYRLPRLAIAIWKKIMQHRYPGGFQEITTMYCASSSPNHPMVIYARPDWL